MIAYPKEQQQQEIREGALTMLHAAIGQPHAPPWLQRK
jgi:hypothetical protein